MITKILIGADIVPTKSNYDYFINGDIDYLIGDELKELFSEADFVMLNLETPLTDTKNEIVKSGPRLIAPTECINGLVKINPHFFTLANNHILDQNESGLKDTIECLSRNSISYAGVGNNINDMIKSVIKEINGIRIGIYCCAEHEFSIATENRAGANPYDPLYCFDEIKALKEKSDIVVVLYHGGKECYRYPSLQLQRVFRKFSEVGANYVIAQHTHCIGCIEEYEQSTLVYGQGNFLFDDSDSEYWQTSMLLELEIDENKKSSLSFIPCVKCENRVRMADAKEKAQILSEFAKRNEEIKSESFLREQYKKFAETKRKEYSIRLLGRIGRSKLFRLINKLSANKLVKAVYSKKFMTGVLNCFECEAHRELVAEIMKQYE